ncbi:MAG TPA: S1/P1 nuclease [Polyangiales bacterium]|nr:S1/P1 nuclease [Polyangiales bacterium]
MIRIAGFAILCLACTPLPVRAWGDEGHEVVALIAEHYLNPTVRAKVHALLASDDDKSTAHDLADAATWADKFRDSDRDAGRVHYTQTWQWHFVDIELDKPDYDAACFQHPDLPKGTLASLGPTADCVTDKIEQFITEIKASSTAPEERVHALKFVLHFVGDLHQPLHASDAHDRGGNDKQVSALGLPVSSLHAYWDTQFVQALGRDPHKLAAQLIKQIAPRQQKAWSHGSLKSWALETFQAARTRAYAGLPKPNDDKVYELDDKYVKAAKKTASEQLERAGVRLAACLNAAFGAKG